MMTYTFDGEVHTLSREEYEAITETGRCDLELYIAPDDCRVAAWWKAQLTREEGRNKIEQKVRRLRAHSCTIRRTRENLQKEIDKRLDKSPVIEVHNYTPKERKDAVNVPKAVDRGGYHVRPKIDFRGPHAGNG